MALRSLHNAIRGLSCQTRKMSNCCSSCNNLHRHSFRRMRIPRTKRNWDVSSTQFSRNPEDWMTRWRQALPAERQILHPSYPTSRKTYGKTIKAFSPRTIACWDVPHVEPCTNGKQRGSCWKLCQPSAQRTSARRRNQQDHRVGSCRPIRRSSTVDDGTTGGLSQRRAAHQGQSTHRQIAGQSGRQSIREPGLHPSSKFRSAYWNGKSGLQRAHCVGAAGAADHRPLATERVTPTVHGRKQNLLTEASAPSHALGDPSCDCHQPQRADGGF